MSGDLDTVKNNFLSKVQNTVNLNPLIGDATLKYQRRQSMVMPGNKFKVIKKTYIYFRHVIMLSGNWHKLEKKK